MPQSSHSSTGFHPRRFAQTSHFALSNVLVKNSSSGFHRFSVEREGDALRTGTSFSRPFVVLFEPGLMSVKRCTIGRIEPRIVDPPSVATAIEGAIMLEEDAVWKESIESMESDEVGMVVVVGVGPCAPVARG